MQYAEAQMFKGYLTDGKLKPSTDLPTCNRDECALFRLLAAPPTLHQLACLAQGVIYMCGAGSWVVCWISRGSLIVMLLPKRH